jgi:hypothetical protein
MKASPDSSNKVIIVTHEDLLDICGNVHIIGPLDELY